MSHVRIDEDNIILEVIPGDDLPPMHEETALLFLPANESVKEGEEFNPVAQTSSKRVVPVTPVKTPVELEEERVLAFMSERSTVALIEMVAEQTGKPVADVTASTEAKYRAQWAAPPA